MPRFSRATAHRLGHSLRTGVSVSIAALVAVATPALADFRPSVVAVEGDTGQVLAVTDLAARDGRLAMSVHVSIDEGPRQALAWSDDPEADWAVDVNDGRASRQSQATVCADQAAMVYAASDDEGASWVVATYAVPYDGSSGATRDWTTAGVARYPDVACVRDHELVAAWFERDGSGWDVRLRTREPQSAGASPQSFNLGRGTPGRRLAVATSSNRVYVAWFDGRKLKVRRFAIGAAPNHTLTSLGTSTIARLSRGSHPELGADGSRVVLAYMDRNDLKVRRSTNRGVSFGGARTLRDRPSASKVGAAPTTVAVDGARVAIGATEIGAAELIGKGYGYKSTNGGVSYRQVSGHSSGRVVATLFTPGSTPRYAEAWDQAVTQPLQPVVRFRRE